MRDSKRFFRAAGYVFSYERATGEAKVKIEMWREDPTTGERFWVTVATCAPDRKAAYHAAMALVGWVRALDVAPRADTKAQAVAECLAIMNDRLAQAQATRSNPALSEALDRVSPSKPAAKRAATRVGPGVVRASQPPPARPLAACGGR